MAIIQDGGATSNLLTIDANGRAQVNLPSNYNANLNPQITGGFVNNIFEADSGSITGVPLQRQGDISANYRQRVGVDTILFNECFNGTAINTANIKTTLGTMTNTVANGFSVLNASSLTTASTYAIVNTYRAFPAYGTYPLQLEVEAIYAAPAVQANSVTEIGFGFAATTATPTDGVFFRYTSTGEFRAVINYNGAETQSTSLTPPTVNQRHHYFIVIGNDYVEFWVDNVLYANLAVPVGNGMAVVSQSQQLLIRTYNTATPPSNAVQLKIANVSISLGDMNSNRDWKLIQAGMGGGGFQGQTGGTMGSTANWVNSTVPATATLSNTAAGYTTLGGLFQFVAVAGAETDYALFGYQLPALSATSPAKSLVIKGVKIASYIHVAGATVTAANTLMWAVGVGSTAVSLANTEGAASKARRVIPVGVQSFSTTAAIGTTASDTVLNFDCPVVVEPGCFVHVILRISTGAATTFPTIRGTVTFDCVWE